MSQALALLNEWGYTKAPADPRPPAQLLSMADGYRWEMPDASTAERQARLYQQLTWISTAVDHTAGIAASAQFSVKQVAGEPGGPDDQDLPNHEFEKLLRRPNPSQSRGEFLRDAFATYKVTGNLYLFLNAPAEGTPPDELWIVPTHMMKPIPDGRSYVAGYEFTAPGKAPEMIPAWKIMHLKTYNPLNPFVGLSAVQSLALAGMGDLAQQKFNLSMFDENAGKMPGIIVFKDMVAQPMWEEITRKRNSEWGKGAQHAGPMMLRGVGQNGVEYIQAQLSQKEMEFLESRGFTRSEIYGKLAPGLDNILSINATEANANIGKIILVDFGVWPVLDQLGQKFSADLLPLYGEGLEGAFDDIRRAADEDQFFTINEIRERRFHAPPLYLDESQETALEEEQKVTAENRQMGVEMLQQAKPKPAPFGKADEPLPEAPATAKPPAPKLPGKPGRKLDPRGLMFAAQIGPATPLPGDPTKPPPAPPMPPAPPPTGQADADKPPEKEPTEPAKAAELEAWERFAVKRLGRTGGRDFEPRVLDVFTAGRIRTALKAAGSEADVRAVFARERDGSDVARLAAAIEAVEKKL